MTRLDPIQAFAFAFCGCNPETMHWHFRKGDELYVKWEPAVTWGLDFARARRGRTQTLVADTAQVMAARPLVDDATYPDGHEPRWTAAVTAMIAAAQAQAKARPARAAEQGRAA